VVSFNYAVAGLHRFAVTDRNAWIHAIASAAAVAGGLWLQLTMPEWRWVSAAVAIVAAALIAFTVFGPHLLVLFH
jgi:diacylglycerol kinase